MPRDEIERGARALVGIHCGGVVAVAGYHCQLRLLRAGKLRALAVSGPRRFGQMSDVPTVMETVPGYNSDIWYGVLVPGATPAPLVARLHADIVYHLQSADFKARLAADGSEPVANSPSEFAAAIQADVQRWSKLIKETGIKLQ